MTLAGPDVEQAARNTITPPKRTARNLVERPLIPEALIRC
jgi:hypothetical protein